MWVRVKDRLPKKDQQFTYFVYGLWNTGTQYEKSGRGTARWNGMNWVDDQHGEDLIGLNNSITHWWNFEDIDDPE